MVDVVCIGSVALDLFFRDECLTLKKKRFFLAIGGKYVVEYFIEGVGGGGGNIAVGLSRAGFSCSLWSEIGTGGVSKLIKETLASEKVNLDLLEQREGFANISCILLSPRGERTIINHRSHETKLNFDSKKKEYIKKAKLLFLGNMPELSLEFKENILKFAKDSSVSTAVNFGVKDCRQGLKKLQKLLSLSDFVIVNRYELADILGTPANELLLGSADYHTKLGLQENAILVVTDGEFGSYAQSKDGWVKEKAIRVEKVVDATGAGDAFTSGFLAALLTKKKLNEALQIGAKNSASVIQIVNAQAGLLTREKLFA